MVFWSFLLFILLAVLVLPVFSFILPAVLVLPVFSFILPAVLVLPVFSFILLVVFFLAVVPPLRDILILLLCACSWWSSGKPRFCVDGELCRGEPADCHVSKPGTVRPRGTCATGGHPFLRSYLWLSLCTLCLLACQVRITVDDSGLRCYVYVTLISSMVCWHKPSKTKIIIITIIMINKNNGIGWNKILQS